MTVTDNQLLLIIMASEDATPGPWDSCDDFIHSTSLEGRDDYEKFSGHYRGLLVAESLAPRDRAFMVTAQPSIVAEIAKELLERRRRELPIINQPTRADNLVEREPMEPLQFKTYRKKALTEAAAWEAGADMTNVTINPADAAAGSPKTGDMIARDPSKPGDSWLVSKEYFEASYELVT